MIITKDNEPIYRKANGTYLMRHPATGQVNYWCGFPDDPNGCHADVEKYITGNNYVVQPEPLPPPPTAAELEAAAEAQRQALFIDYDHAVSKCRRHIEEGDTSRDWPAMLAAWNAYGMALEALNDEPGWFKAPVWPTKPEI